MSTSKPSSKVRNQTDFFTNTHKGLDSELGSTNGQRKLDRLCRDVQGRLHVFRVELHRHVTPFLDGMFRVPNITCLLKWFTCIRSFVRRADCVSNQYLCNFLMLLFCVMCISHFCCPYLDTEVVRPYTPVDQNLAPASHDSSLESDLYLMIKVYPDGVFTPHLNSLHIGKSCPSHCMGVRIYLWVMFDNRNHENYLGLLWVVSHFAPKEVQSVNLALCDNP